MTTTTHNPKVERALADIEAAKQNVDQDVAECLDALGNLIKSSGDPDAVFDWFFDAIGRERGEATP